MLVDFENKDKNIKKLLSYYDSISDSEKEAFTKAIKYLCECFAYKESKKR